LPKEPPASEITPEALYLRRRDFLRNAALFAGTTTLLGGGLLYIASGGRADNAEPSSKGPANAAVGPPDAGGANAPGPYARGPYGTDEATTPFKDVTTYNNFYEFGTDKSDPSENAHTLRPRPWSVSFEGEIKKPQVVDIDALVKWFPL